MECTHYVSSNNVLKRSKRSPTHSVYFPWQQEIDKDFDYNRIYKATDLLCCNKAR